MGGEWLCPEEHLQQMSLPFHLQHHFQEQSPPVPSDGARCVERVFCRPMKAFDLHSEICWPIHCVPSEPTPAKRSRLPGVAMIHTTLPQSRELLLTLPLLRLS
jgi:hypothetical protein